MVKHRFGANPSTGRQVLFTGRLMVGRVALDHEMRVRYLPGDPDKLINTPNIGDLYVFDRN